MGPIPARAPAPLLHHQRTLAPPILCRQPKQCVAAVHGDPSWVHGMWRAGIAVATIAPHRLKLCGHSGLLPALLPAGRVQLSGARCSWLPCKPVCSRTAEGMLRYHPGFPHLEPSVPDPFRALTYKCLASEQHARPTAAAALEELQVGSPPPRGAARRGAARSIGPLPPITELRLAATDHDVSLPSVPLPWLHVGAGRCMHAHAVVPGRIGRQQHAALICTQSMI